MGADAHPVCELLVLACVYGLLADRLWINHDKFFDLLLFRTGSNNNHEADCCKKFDVLRHLYLLSLVIRGLVLKPAICPAIEAGHADAWPVVILSKPERRAYVDKSVDNICDSIAA